MNKQLKKEMTLLASRRTTPTTFKAQPSLYLELELVLQKFERNTCSACTCLEEIISTCEAFSPGNHIQNFAIQLLKTLRSHKDSLHSPYFVPISPSPELI